ncbi:MAG: class I SAM-dependent methyltransferase [Methylocystaceae bacterium]|nr:class I SAM-dependent methyltransferase [Methylocystaceae bacterium]
MENYLDYWEDIFASQGWGAYPPEELVRTIARNFRKVENKSSIKILEIGCGPGPNIWYLVREGYSVAGIDGSKTAIAQAQQRLEKEGLPSLPPSVDLKVGNFVNLPWPDDYFDAVIDVEGLYANKFDDIKTVVHEVKRTLKKGGFFFGKMFGDKTTGSDSGERVGDRTRLNPTQGPCSGNAVAHFFNKNDLQLIFQDFDELKIDYSLRTEQEEKIDIFEWLVWAKY